MSLFILGMTKFTNKPNKDGGLGFSIWSLGIFFLAFGELDFAS